MIEIDVGEAAVEANSFAVSGEAGFAVHSKEETAVVELTAVVDETLRELVQVMMPT